MSLIIDCHGHYTTAPKVLEDWRNRQIAGIKDAAVKPKVGDLKISDDELRESIAANQLRLMKERGSDVTLFSPRATSVPTGTPGGACTMRPCIWPAMPQCSKRRISATPLGPVE